MMMSAALNSSSPSFNKGPVSSLRPTTVAFKRSRSSASGSDRTISISKKRKQMLVTSPKRTMTPSSSGTVVPISPASSSPPSSSSSSSPAFVYAQKLNNVAAAYIDVGGDNYGKAITTLKKSLTLLQTFCVTDEDDDSNFGHSFSEHSTLDGCVAYSLKQQRQLTHKTPFSFRSTSQDGTKSSKRRRVLEDDDGSSLEDLVAIRVPRRCVEECEQNQTPTMGFSTLLCIVLYNLGLAHHKAILALTTASSASTTNNNTKILISYQAAAERLYKMTFDTAAHKISIDDDSADRFLSEVVTESMRRLRRQDQDQEKEEQELKQQEQASEKKTNHHRDLEIVASGTSLSTSTTNTTTDDSIVTNCVTMEESEDEDHNRDAAHRRRHKIIKIQPSNERYLLAERFGATTTSNSKKRSRDDNDANHHLDHHEDDDEDVVDGFRSRSGSLDDKEANEELLEFDYYTKEEEDEQKLTSSDVKKSISAAVPSNPAPEGEALETGAQRTGGLNMNTTKKTGSGGVLPVIEKGEERSRLIIRRENSSENLLRVATSSVILPPNNTRRFSQ